MPVGLPAPIRERGPGPSRSCRGETKVREARDNGAATLEQTTAEQHPEEMGETQIGANGNIRDHTRQNVIDTVE